MKSRIKWDKRDRYGRTPKGFISLGLAVVFGYSSYQIETKGRYY